MGNSNSYPPRSQWPTNESASGGHQQWQQWRQQHNQQQGQGWADWTEQYEPEPPQSDSQGLRRFAQAYDQQVRRTTSPALDAAELADAKRGREGAGALLVVGLVVFVLLLAVAIGLGLVFSHP